MDNPAVLQAGHPMLRTRSRDVRPSEILETDLLQTIAQLYETMKKGRGIGISAPQIGVNVNLIVLEDCEEFMSQHPPEILAEQERYPFERKVFFNPRFTPICDEHTIYFENCLSVPGYAGLVRRHRELELTALDESAEPVTWRMRGWPARLLQHEIDHLDGVLYTDRILPRSLCTMDEGMERWFHAPLDEVCAALGIPLE